MNFRGALWRPGLCRRPARDRSGLALALSEGSREQRKTLPQSSHDFDKDGAWACAAWNDLGSPGVRQLIDLPMTKGRSSRLHLLRHRTCGRCP